MNKETTMQIFDVRRVDGKNGSYLLICGLIDGLGIVDVFDSKVEDEKLLSVGAVVDVNIVVKNYNHKLVVRCERV